MSAGYSALDRATALAKLAFFVDELWGKEENLAFAQLWDRFVDREDEIS